MNPRFVRFLWGVILTTFFLALSCVPPKVIPFEKPKRDPFSRVYPVPFRDFHPKLNQALQKYAKEKPGNSFQVARLGSDSVVIRGFFQKEPNQTRFPLVIIARPTGSDKSNLEIKPSASQGGTSLGPLEASADELFRIIERETGFIPAK